MPSLWAKLEPLSEVLRRGLSSFPVASPVSTGVPVGLTAWAETPVGWHPGTPIRRGGMLSLQMLA